MFRPLVMSEAVLYHDYRSGSFQDFSQKGNDGTPSNVNFTGNGLQTENGYIEIDDNSTLDITGPITLAAFIKTTESAGSIISKYSASDNNRSFVFAVSAGKLQLIASGNGTESPGVGGTALVNDDLWHYAAVSYHPSTNSIQFYIDGVLDRDTTLTVTGDAIFSGSSDVRVLSTVNGGAVPLNSGIKCAMIFSSSLTATQHSQLYGYLSDICFDKKPKLVSYTDLKISPTETGLVAGWNMKPVNDKIIDQTSNANDGSLIDGPLYQKTLLGDSLLFNGVNSYINCGNDSSLQITGNLTISCYIKTTVKGDRIVSKDDGTNRNYLLRIDTTTGRPEITIFRSNTPYTIEAASKNVDDGLWHHIVAVNDGSDLKIYVDGELDGTNVGGGGAIDNDTVDLEIGRYGTGGGSEYFDGNIVAPKIYNEAKDLAWVESEYKRMKPVLFKTSNGAYESINNQTEVLENTPFKISSGAWKVENEVINGIDTKVYECITAGICYIPTAEFGQTPKESAKGGFEFYINKGASNTPRVDFINDIVGITDSGNGYQFLIDSTEVVEVRELNSGSPTSKFATNASFINAEEWYKINIDVTNLGSFTTSINDTVVSPLASGSNPFTDTTNTESNFLRCDFDAGDKIALIVKTLIV